MVLQELEFLSNRERQIVDIVYRQTEATAREVMERLPQPPGYSAVRSMLSRLVDKGVLTVDTSAKNHRYTLNVSRKKTRSGELGRLVSSFFGGSKKAAIVNLLSSDHGDLSREELDEIQKLIEAHRAKQDRK